MRITILFLAIIVSAMGQTSISDATGMRTSNIIQGTTWSASRPTQLHVRETIVENERYLVIYRVNPDAVTFPAIPGGLPHYDAKITIYRMAMVSGLTGPLITDPIQIGPERSGVWVPDPGCFEDKPEELIRQALAEQKAHAAIPVGDLLSSSTVQHLESRTSIVNPCQRIQNWPEEEKIRACENFLAGLKNKTSASK